MYLLCNSYHKIRYRVIVLCHLCHLNASIKCSRINCLTSKYRRNAKRENEKENSKKTLLLTDILEVCN